MRGFSNASDLSVIGGITITITPYGNDNGDCEILRTPSDVDSDVDSDGDDLSIQHIDSKVK